MNRCRPRWGGQANQQLPSFRQRVAWPRRRWCDQGIPVTYTRAPRMTERPMVRWLAAFAFSLILSMIAAPGCDTALAQGGQGAYPTKPVKFIIPYPAGGSNDVLARIVGDKLQAKW